jgi:hypothetical protein
MDTYILIFSFVLLGFLTYIQGIFSISLILKKIWIVGQKIDAICWQVGYLSFNFSKTLSTTFQLKTFPLIIFGFIYMLKLWKKNKNILHLHNSY